MPLFMTVTLNIRDNYSCGAMIDNGENAPICILNLNDRERKEDLKNSDPPLAATVFWILFT